MDKKFYFRLICWSLKTKIKKITIYKSQNLLILNKSLSWNKKELLMKKITDITPFNMKHRFDVIVYSTFHNPIVACVVVVALPTTQVARTLLKNQYNNNSHNLMTTVVAVVVCGSAAAVCVVDCVAVWCGWSSGVTASVVVLCCSSDWPVLEGCCESAVVVAGWDEHYVGPVEAGTKRKMGKTQLPISR